MLHSVRSRKEWTSFGSLTKADPLLGAAWWSVLLLRGVLPAVFAIAMGVLVGTVQHNQPLAGPLAPKLLAKLHEPSSGAIFVGGQPLARVPASDWTTRLPWYAAVARRSGQNASGRITVLVSHRFSTVRMADLLLVLDGSHLVEAGTHEELIANGGQCAELYGIQADAYR